MEGREFKVHDGRWHEVFRTGADVFLRPLTDEQVKELGLDVREEAAE